METLTPSSPEGRRSARAALKKRAGLVVNLRGRVERLPCLIVDSSRHGLRVRVNCKLRPGHTVEAILGEGPLQSVACKVIWTGKPESEQEGQVGLQIV
jgi:hypothetical protein